MVINLWRSDACTITNRFSLNRHGRDILASSSIHSMPLMYVLDLSRKPMFGWLREANNSCYEGNYGCLLFCVTAGAMEEM